MESIERTPRQVVDKAYAYVTRRAPHRLLVFEHPHSDRGFRAPKGTIEPDECPTAAVKRELHEESGLVATDADHVVTDEWDHPRKPKTYRRHFFHVTPATVRDQWVHEAADEGSQTGLPFRYFWTPIADPVPLDAEMDDYLPHLRTD
ncbi:MAG: NUDIX domain-containing protein [Haloarculaceae archaeon]